MNQKAVESLAASLGLKVSTVVDLLNAGWTFRERMNQPRLWEGPEAKIGHIAKEHYASNSRK